MRTHRRRRVRARHAGPHRCALADHAGQAVGGPAALRDLSTQPAHRRPGDLMDFNLPTELTAYLAELDDFIARDIAPLQARDDNQRFFDQRREWARTDFDNQGLPRPEWEALMREARRRADRAGHLRFALPREYGGRDGSSLWMAVIREHLAAKGLGLHNDLQTEHSIVANHPLVLAMRDFGTPAQRDSFIPGLLDESKLIAFALTE